MLKYLFSVQFSDGSFYYQTPEDQSLMKPERSAFYDVLTFGKDIYYFELTNEGKKKFRVYPQHKQIEILEDNKTALTIPAPKEELHNPRIIYFRNHQVPINLDNIEDQTDTIVSYTLGYQANRADGSNFQQIIEIY